MSHHILVVEDDAVTREKLTGYFEREGYRVTAVENGQEMRAVLAEQEVALVMLDINLPGEDGLLLTRELRARSTVGIILVTGRSDAVDRIVGLEMGADDYVTKPFELRELLVRVKNLLWRISLAAAQPSEPAVADDAVRFGPWRFDIPRRQLSRDGVPVRLTKAEYEVLVAFIANAGRVLSRERILALTSHRGDGPSDRTIDVLIRRLRGKMELDPRDPQLFVTVHGEGYLFAGELAA
ncbi:two-component system response regulator TorR [Aeromonas dhakensis]|uniref:two-component system response regulator TorR n=1 Tax=Aeromonas dhakensis TaxID=196024 RepID=UPI0003718F63|nr:two-component system response regulator TorR [Aeromonas dhakensis]MBL0673444.1 two-component system response regulator TorR [Aeromonas dhakensis]MCR6738392.1 two-component system response regulator TorR [Aeromonas dhakensis]MDX7697694.1 two-component system response regulator TorR [Aeromonas dhakensis]MDX7740168.1 two-component system response regulator TorR [Aeromonas dhakensis]RQM92236.1 two-component system response regulator TorR [Aeromonas dhakensis]